MVNVSAWTEAPECITLNAGSGMSGSQYKCVLISTSGNVNLATSGGQVTGILYNKPSSGDPCIVVIAGVAKAMAGAAITNGAEVCADSGGLVIAAANTSGAGGQQIVGRALTAATAANAIIPVLIGVHKVLQSG
jgi:Uncharacterized conserved protein (DUF2190)